MEHSQDLICIHDLQGFIRSANPAAARLLGYDLDELLCMNIRDILAPEAQGGFELYLRRMRKRGAVSGEMVVLTRIGERRVWEYNNSLRAEGVPEPIVRGMARDITERKQAEAALAASEAKLRALFAAMRELVIVYDRDGRYLEIAPTDTSLLIKPPTDMIGKTLHEVLPPAQAGLLLQHIQHAIETQQAVTLDYSLSLGGREVWFAGAISPLAGERAILVAHDITDRRQAEAELRRRAQELGALHETTRDLAAQQDLSVLLETIVERATALLDASYGTLGIYDAAQDAMELTAVKGLPVPLGSRLRSGEGMAGYVTQTRNALIVEDYSRWEHRLPHFTGSSLGAALEVPMLYRGELVGTLGVGEMGTSRKYTDDDARLLGLFASQVAGAVHGVRLFDEARRRLSELEAVARISVALRAAQSLDEMLPILLDETLAVLGAEAGSLLLYDSACGELRPAGGRSWFTALDQRPIKPGEGIAGRVFASDEAHVSREFASDAHARASSRHQIPAGWGGACLPIHTSREVIGVLFVSVPLPRELIADEIRLLNTLAEIAGNAIHRTQLHQQTEKRLRQVQALRAIDIAISSGVNLRLTLDIVLSQTMTQLGVDAAAVLRFSPDTHTLECAAARGFRSNAFAGLRLGLEESYAGQAVLERRVVSVADFPGATPKLDHPAQLASERFIGVFAAPLIAKGEVLGVLELFCRAPLNPDPEWLEFLEALAGQAAIAVDSATLFDNLQRANADLTLAYDTTIEGWSRALDLRDQETEGHTLRVTELTLRLAQAMGLSEAERVHIRRGALLHDIGKMGVPDGILLKSGPLTEEEWVAMKKHPQYAYDMLRPINYLRPALDIPYDHHEKWDGTGYPRGLKGEEIPLAARMFAVVDVWDALCSDRPYRPAWPPEKVRAHVKSLAGTHFDPQVVEVFLKVLSDPH